MIGKVIYRKRYELISIFGVLLLLMFISSFFMFYAEADAQPNAFHNILDTFWWSLVTFTTVGYGDVYPITAIGKVLSGIVVLIGIMLFALPAEIVMVAGAGDVSVVLGSAFTINLFLSCVTLHQF